MSLGMNSYSIIIYARSIRVPIYTYFTVHVLISTFILIFCPLYNLFLMWNTHDIHARCSVILFDSCSLLKYFILNWSWPVQKMGMLISTNSFKKSTPATLLKFILLTQELRPLKRIIRLNLMACLDPAPNAGPIY